MKNASRVDDYTVISYKEGDEDQDILVQYRMRGYAKDDGDLLAAEDLNRATRTYV